MVAPDGQCWWRGALVGFFASSARERRDKEGYRTTEESKRWEARAARILQQCVVRFVADCLYRAFTVRVDTGVRPHTKRSYWGPPTYQA